MKFELRASCMVLRHSNSLSHLRPHPGAPPAWPTLPAAGPPPPDAPARLTPTHTYTLTHTQSHSQGPSLYSRHVECYLQRRKSLRYPIEWTLSALEKGSNLEKLMKWHPFHQSPWKEDILPPLCQGMSKTNPESVPEAITWIEINSSRVTTHGYTCITIAWHTLAILKEYWIFPPQTIDYS
jgi:hypothetical protein